LGAMDLISIDARVKINEVLLTQKLVPVMLEKLRSVESSLSSSKAMFLLTEHARQSTFRNETPAFISPNILPPNSTVLIPVDYKNMGINLTVGLVSS